MTDLVADMCAQRTTSAVTSATILDRYRQASATGRAVLYSMYPGLALEFAAVERDEDRQRRMAGQAVQS
jgi:hypothetical protein